MTAASVHRQFLGIDPGIGGGCVCIDENERALWWHRAPIVEGPKRKEYDLARMDETVRAARIPMKVFEVPTIATYTPVPATMAIELVSARPSAAAPADPDEEEDPKSARARGQAHGSIATARLMFSAGAWQALAAAHGLELEIIPPVVWVPRMIPGLARGAPYAERKRAAAQAAATLFPELRETLRVKANWGIADAALLAAAGLRIAEGRRAHAARLAARGAHPPG